MEQVWKFPLAVTFLRQPVLLPHNAMILSVQPQHNKIVLWALCDVNVESTERQIILLGTGHDAPDGMLNYINTFQYQSQSGILVFHAFEIVDANS